MQQKSQVSVRLAPAHLKELEDLQPHFGDSKSEVARHLLIEALEEKHGLDGLRIKKAIR